MNNIYGTIELALDGKEITYVLSAFIDLEKPGNHKDMESLAFYNNYGLKDQELIDLWDNETYLYNTLYKNVLVNWVNNKEINSAQGFADLIQVKGVSLDDLEELLELFKKAEQLKFFKKKC